MKTDFKSLAVAQNKMLDIIASILDCKQTEIASKLLALKREKDIYSKYRDLIEKRLLECDAVLSVNTIGLKHDYYDALKKELLIIKSDALK